MSGVKSTTVTISSTELNNLRVQANNATTLAAQNTILNRQNNALIQAQSNLERRLNTMETHNRNMQQQVAGFKTEVRLAVERAVKESEAAARAAKEEARRMQQEITRAAAQNARDIEETNRRVDERLRQTEETLGHAMQQQNRRIEEARRCMDRIQAGIVSLAEMADELHAAAWTIARNAQDFAHGVELIGGMGPMHAQLDRAGESIHLTATQPTNSPAARQTAADAFAFAQDFYQRAAAAEEMWQLRRLAATQAAEAAAARIESTRTLRVEDEDENGKPVSIEVDVDRWSDGALTALNERLTALYGAIEGSRTLEDLDAIRAAADRISTEVMEAAASANIAAHESQNRSETAEDFAQSLSDHGMTLVDHGFQGGDKRGVHRIRMRDAVTGDEVVITQTPIHGSDGSITTRVEADLFSDTLSGETFERRGRDMYETLGLSADDRHQQTEVQTVPGYETRPSDRNIGTIPITRQPRQLPLHDLDGIRARCDS